MTLDPAFLTIPLAHRGLHDRAAGRVENSPAAFAAAMDAGYGIELDVQLSSDGQAMVFHDEALDRLTIETGRVRARTAAQLATIGLAGGGDTIPRLADTLAQVAGRVPVLIEIKDQDGALGPEIGELERAVARDLAAYDGPAAVMSFNPHSVRAMRDLAPQVPRGLTTDAFRASDWPGVPSERLARLAGFADYDDCRATFVSHDANDLDNPGLARLGDTGAAILTWTVRSAAEEARARRVAQNITFEGYLPNG